MRWDSDKQMIKALESRLRWFMNEADEDEFDSKEVTAIVDLLEAMDPIEKREGDFYTASKAQDRFWTFYVFRERLEEDELPYPLSMRIQIRLRRFLRSSAVANGAFAAALVVAMILGGTAVVCAQKEGFFYKYDSRYDKSAVITSPSSTSVDSESSGYKKYQSIKEVPVKYLSCIWTPSGIADELAIQSVEMREDKIAIKMECEFKNESTGEFINTSKKSYKDSIVTTDELYDGFVFLNKENIDGIEVEYLRKVNDDYTEYIVAFEYGNCRYILNSNLDFDVVTSIIEESIKNDNL